MLPAIIDHATLTTWKTRPRGEVHGEIMANIDTLLVTALRYDDAVILTRNQEKKILELQLELDEARLSACSTWRCAGRK